MREEISTDVSLHIFGSFHSNHQPLFQLTGEILNTRTAAKRRISRLFCSTEKKRGNLKSTHVMGKMRGG